MRAKNEQSLSEVLENMIRVLKLKKNLHTITIEKIWEAKMGKTIATYTKELTIRGSTLYINIESASLRSELSFGREKIRTMLNEELGEDFLKEVVVR
jgi:predicted nucleic acid-binding Zn ribbon protein